MTAALAAHLRAWFGAWPAGRGDGIEVVASERRDAPGWDGAVRPLIGAVRPDGTGALVVAPRLLEQVAAVAAGRSPDAVLDGDLRATVGELVHGPGAVLGGGVMRWIARGEDELSDEVDELGVWLDHDDDRVPPWLHPFGGDALVALDDDGRYMAGVGVKRHDETGHELAVVTAEDHRGQGLARRLVATAARTELARVPVVTYLHGRGNVGSARVADAVGFRDRGWRIIGVFGGEAPG